MTKIHTFTIDLDWNLISDLNQIDRFDALWASTEKKEARSLKQLKSVATVRSVGASTRIEGSKMTDEEVDVLLQNINIDKLEDRDSQEVVGYFEAMDLITNSYGDIKITESSIKNLHNILMKFNKKDQWHRGDYKQQSNSVEVTLPDGARQIIFKTTPPGMETKAAMRALIEWYHEDQATHPLVKSALFSYEFVSIHPFQDGNGRLSRLLSTLLLLKNGYKWIQYVSLEGEIESRKSEYYRVLRNCQSQRPGEDVALWIQFFFAALKKIQSQLEQKLEHEGASSRLSPRKKSILSFIENHPGSQSGDIASKLDIPNPTVKKLLRDLADKKHIEKFGSGRGTNYSVM